MFIESGQPMLVNIPYFIILEKRDKQPEGYLLATMEEQRAHDEIHALHVAQPSIV